eukprot:CAMPEP_0180286528 /NCGR_PEP_ID=MMETSP0988-20121125/12672_1 /TAXON_ID=697907 /ORGANISM="non described non described, Strain CCMP2293" /LENGTH=77 /DNA_ID=CAMNT_0022260363 /DNA_START=50 /DNA_END=280 /DNA_ORIENTATION=+
MSEVTLQQLRCARTGTVDLMAPALEPFAPEAGPSRTRSSHDARARRTPRRAYQGLPAPRRAKQGLQGYLAHKKPPPP